MSYFQTISEKTCTKTTLSKTPTLQRPHAYLRSHKFMYRTPESDKSHSVTSQVSKGRDRSQENCSLDSQSKRLRWISTFKFQINRCGNCYNLQPPSHVSRTGSAFCRCLLQMNGFPASPTQFHALPPICSQPRPKQGWVWLGFYLFHFILNNS